MTFYSITSRQSLDTDDVNPSSNLVDAFPAVGNYSSELISLILAVKEDAENLDVEFLNRCESSLIVFNSDRTRNTACFS